MIRETSSIAMVHSPKVKNCFIAQAYWTDLFNKVMNLQEYIIVLFVYGFSIGDLL